MNRRYSLEELHVICRQVRRDILRMVTAVNSGHPGGSMGCAEYFVAMFYEILHHSPHNFAMDGIEEDVFVLSNGHISPVLYSVLARTGYFPITELNTFRKLDSRLQGHPATHEHLPGVRVATGSLGQGLSVAVGAALAKRLNGDNHCVFALMGDGELNEGQVWEAALFAAHHKVDNLVVTIDWNGKQIDGNVKDVMDTGDLAAKFRAFGWEIVYIKDGNNIELVLEEMDLAQSLVGQGKPIVVLMRTKMGKGVDFMEDKYEWHGKAPNKEQFEQAMTQLAPTPLGDY